MIKFNRKNIVLALPSYNGWRKNIRPVTTALTRGHRIYSIEIAMSLLAMNFNMCWAAALNMRSAEKVTHFIMLHADVIPTEEDWIDVMLNEMAKYKADVLSVVIPVKNTEGLTSTAYETDDLWNPRRLNMYEIMDKPETWTDPLLLVNTGCFIVDFTKPWVEKICFTIRDRIILKDGKYTVGCQSEDWDFTRQCKALGASVYVTRKVPLTHHGETGFPNSCAWGMPVEKNTLDQAMSEIVG